MIYRGKRPDLMAVPAMTPEQRAKALEKTAEARTARSALLAGVRSGTTSVAEVYGRSGEELVKRTRWRRFFERFLVTGRRGSRR
ncbi:hypothetical protein GCM10022419_130700 [Nonomuraea rosea]|uniref:Uncharacterized protein n=1 Tax=Nonomuraea rosea TaxID=638574 RepID=A0ABP7A0Y0_9ACTN